MLSTGQPTTMRPPCDYFVAGCSCPCVRHTRASTLYTNAAHIFHLRAHAVLITCGRSVKDNGAVVHALHLLHHLCKAHRLINARDAARKLAHEAILRPLHGLEVRRVRGGVHLLHGVWPSVHAWISKQWGCACISGPEGWAGSAWAHAACVAVSSITQFLDEMWPDGRRHGHGGVPHQMARIASHATHACGATTHKHGDSCQGAAHTMA